ncbi:hypothetical protein BC628DRAFT_1143401 [Trametes gibbosa]|nr:hypothetical protein BC628DRAFT_1143401 [Trametes gibbosa]
MTAPHRVHARASGLRVHPGGTAASRRRGVHIPCSSPRPSVRRRRAQYHFSTDFPRRAGDFLVGECVLGAGAGAGRAITLSRNLARSSLAARPLVKREGSGRGRGVVRSESRALLVAVLLRVGCLCVIRCALLQLWGTLAACDDDDDDQNPQGRVFEQQPVSGPNHSGRSVIAAVGALFAPLVHALAPPVPY